MKLDTVQADRRDGVAIVHFTSGSEKNAMTHRAPEIAQSIAQLPCLPVRMVKEAVNAVANALCAASSYADGDQSHLSMLALLE